MKVTLVLALLLAGAIAIDWWTMQDPVWTEQEQLCAQWFMTLYPETELSQENLLYGCRQYIKENGPDSFTQKENPNVPTSET